jgi:hypothetical protein
MCHRIFECGFFDRDLIRGGHYGQRSCEPRNRPNTWPQPTKARDVQKVLANGEPSTHGTKQTPAMSPCPFSGLKQT